MSGKLYPSIAETPDVEPVLLQAGFRPLARVPDSARAIDLALVISPALLAVVRSVARATPDDHTALATMVAEGDFVWAALVFSEHPSADGPLGVETFHVSELPRLIERLKELQEAAS